VSAVLTASTGGHGVLRAVEIPRALTEGAQSLGSDGWY
jgi:hypothetical protein